MIKDIKKQQLQDGWNEYNFGCMEGEEVTFAHYVCNKANNEPDFFRWLYDNDSLSDYESDIDFKSFVRSITTDADKDDADITSYTGELLSDIAETYGLDIVETTSERNGYPRNIQGVLTGFETFDEAQRIADDFGLTLIWIDKRDGWQLWHRGETANEPMSITSDDFGDDYSFETDKDSYLEVALERISDMCNNGSSLDDIKDYIDKAEKVADTIDDLDDDQAVVTYLGEYYDTINLHPICFSYDTETIQLAAL